MDLSSQLQAHLGDAFRIERELGGGGMSRVFLATEVRLNRQVAIKVLSPELVQGLNAERFEREILLAASLQQANIVPVLAAGEVDGLPYFTMPFISGAALRARIAEGRLSISEVTAVLRDVAKALAYAHAAGIVHRDIKPDNVLLSGGTAMVTDFGIAKALAASRMADTAEQGATLTQVGTSIGTPPYMAPEQVAGDPNIDHRVDLYALGCVAFEMLTGQTPFGDRPSQQILAAHLSEVPVPVQSLRSDCPPVLARLVAQLLEKEPADRPATAAEVVRRLDEVGTSSSSNSILTGPGATTRILVLYAVAIGIVAVVSKAAVVGIGLPDWTVTGAVGLMLLGLPPLLFIAFAKHTSRRAAHATPTLTPGGTMNTRPLSGTMATIALKASPHLSWRRWIRGGIAVMASFVLLVAAFVVTRSMGIGPAASLFASGQLNSQDKILLASISATSEDSSLAPIIQEAVRAAMSQSSAVKVLDPGDVAGALDQMRRPNTTPLEGSVAQEVAERTGAKAILRGRLARAGSGYAISLELASVGGGTILASMQGSAGGATDLIPAVDDLTRKLRSKIGESLRDVARTVPLEQATTSSIEALRAYTDAVQANDIDQDFDRAVASARKAVGLDSTFALAWRKLSVALFNSQGSQVAQDSAIERAAQYADKLPPQERYMVMGGLYDNHSTKADRSKALAAYQALYRLDSTNAVATNQLARNFASRGEYDSTLRYSKRQYELVPVPSNGTRVVMSLLQMGEIDAATTLLDSIRRADSTDTAEYPISLVAGGLAYASGNWSAARAQADSMTLINNPRAKSDGLLLGTSLDLIAGRLSRSNALTIQRGEFLRSRGEVAFDSVFIAGTDIRFRDRAAEGVSLLDRVRSSAEWRNASPPIRPYLNLIDLYTSAGRPDRARTILAEYRAEIPGAENVELTHEVVTAMEGQIALAEGNMDAALAFYRSILKAKDGGEPPCELCGIVGMAQAFDQADQADSAIVWYQRYLAVPPQRRLIGFNDALYLARTHKRLGELYDSKGERDKAMEQYGAFVEQWKDADPELQPAVATVKARMADLQQQEAP